VGLGRALDLDRAREVARDARDHLRQLDRHRDVVDEEDEHADVDEDEREQHGDGDVRDEVAVRARPDARERQDGVHERRHERAERDLRSAVADEVAQHPRAELRRGQRERDDHDREDDV
jgi:hypothetical protein